MQLLILLDAGSDNLRDLLWMGDSRAVVKGFPNEVKDDIGYSLHYAQIGFKAENAKPFKGLPGVFEIVAPFNKDTYRAVYALKIGDRIYVLHAFQKKAKSGIKTPQRDVDLIKARFKDAKRLEEENV